MKDENALLIIFDSPPENGHNTAVRCCLRACQALKGGIGWITRIIGKI